MNCRLTGKVVASLIFGLCAMSLSAKADMMTVEQLKKLLAQGKPGEALATSYVQGVADGMLAMETMRRKSLLRSKEFCQFYEQQEAGHPLPHPAFYTRQIVERWEAAKRPMNTIAVDMVLSYLSGSYGCK